MKQEPFTDADLLKAGQDWGDPEGVETFSRAAMLEVLTALWDMQRSPECWCDGVNKHSIACKQAQAVSRKYKGLA